MEESYQNGAMPAYGNHSASAQQDDVGARPQHGNLFVKGLPPGS